MYSRYKNWKSLFYTMELCVLRKKGLDTLIHSIKLFKYMYVTYVYSTLFLDDWTTSVRIPRTLNYVLLAVLE